VTLEERARFKAAHTFFKRNATKTGAQFNRTPETVIKYWRMDGLEPLQHGLNPDQIADALRLNTVYKGDPKEAEKYGPHAASTYERHWRNAELPVVEYYKRNILPKSGIDNIVKALALMKYILSASIPGKNFLLLS